MLPSQLQQPSLPLVVCGGRAGTGPAGVGGGGAGGLGGGAGGKSWHSQAEGWGTEFPGLRNQVRRNDICEGERRRRPGYAQLLADQAGQ